MRPRAVMLIKAVPLFVSSLLLTSCTLPDGVWEKVVGWRPMWEEHATPQQIAGWFGFVISFLALALLIMGLGQANKVVKGGSFGKAALLIATIGFTILFTILLPQTVAEAVKLIMPEDFILDTVLRALRIDIDAKWDDLVHAAWASGVSISVPQLFTKGVFVLLMLSFLFNAVGIVTKSLRGVVFTFSGVLGALFFVGLWIGWVLYLGDSYPSWELTVIKQGLNFIYTGVTLVLYGFCFYVIPFSAFILWKDDPEKQETNTEKPPPRDWTGAGATAGKILGGAAILNEAGRQSVHYNNTIYGYPTYQGPNYQLPEENVIDAKVREVPRLSAGKLNDSNDSNAPKDGPVSGPSGIPSGPHTPDKDSTSDPTDTVSNVSQPTWKAHRRDKPQDPIMGNASPQTTEEPPVVVINTQMWRQQQQPQKPGKAERLANASGFVAKATAILGKPEVAAAAKGVEIAARTTGRVIKTRQVKAQPTNDDPIM